MNRTSSTANAFINSLPEVARSTWNNQADLDRRLNEAVVTARTSWPKLFLDTPLFLAYVAERWPPDREPDELPKLLNIGDLYLAAACVHLCPGAVEAFDEHCIRHVPSFLAYQNQSPDFVSEVQQILREKLLTAPSGERPKLADYSGRGALLMWVRAAAIRTALHQLEKADVRKRMSDQEEESLILHGISSAPQGSGADPETLALKQQVRTILRETLREVMSSLVPEQRTLLRFYYVEDMRIDEIGALLKVNKSTISRRLTDARETILSSLRKSLASRLGIGRAEVDSMVNLVASQLDASLASLLRSTEVAK